MKNKSVLGFDKGKVAQQLRSVLYPGLSASEVEALMVCIQCHLLIEDRLNELLHEWLIYDSPTPPDNKKKQEIRDQLFKSIANSQFMPKFNLIKPIFAAWFPKEAKAILKINDLRNDIVHGRAVRTATYDGKLIHEEATLEHVFESAQAASMQLRKFMEMIDDNRAVLENCAKRLKELGEPIR